ncbi:MAG: hypothetical protein GX856_00720 [Gammaproteobacteria bacterium]|nr:hypothetical protein [Gammaproteobacteria bacterium]
MYATTGFPHHLHWSSFELADAVPRRLSELYHFDLHPGDGDGAAANRGEPRRRSAPEHYLPASALPERFHVD